LTPKTVAQTPSLWQIHPFRHPGILQDDDEYIFEHWVQEISEWITSLEKIIENIRNEQFD
jgi:hypothetical protein